MRKTGILLPITSLPSKYGIGCFSKSAYKFIDFLNEAGCAYWQVLPLVPTSYGDSPYASPSTFAGNPYFISPDLLIEEGLITKEDVENTDFGDNPSYVDYGKIYNGRFPLLKKAYLNSNCGNDPEFKKFCEENSDWLDSYVLFDVLKDIYQSSWIDWPEEYRNRDRAALERLKVEQKDEIEYKAFIQYKFFSQWKKIKDYAKSKKVEIIGDLPIYVAFDSADLWGNPELFQVDGKGIPHSVAGCPPDYFSATGQLWGNPLYNWDFQKSNDYQWWKMRVRHSKKLYDIIRIDHFRGFDEYYSIPYGSKDAIHGCWKKGPGIDLFNTLKREFGELNIIAEDLGILTDSVRELLKEAGFPGMKILEFAFDGTESSDYLPYNHVKNCVVYTGTHDNQTAVGWYRSLNDHDRKFADDYMNRTSGEENVNWDLIRLAISSVADTVIIPMQDFLGLGDEARLNTPATLGENWKWRMLSENMNSDLAGKIHELNRIYARNRY